MATQACLRRVEILENDGIAVVATAGIFVLVVFFFKFWFNLGWIWGICGCLGGVSGTLGDPWASLGDLGRPVSIFDRFWVTFVRPSGSRLGSFWPKISQTDPIEVFVGTLFRVRKKN